MKQTNKKSIIEAFIQTGIGTVVGFIMTLLIFPLFGIYTTPYVIGGITLVFMFIAILKNYLIRRLFNWFHYSKNGEKILKRISITLLGSQKKHQSLFESFIQTSTSTLVSFFGSLLIYPLFGINEPVIKIGEITLVFTIISITKNYFVRRLFENEKHG